MNVKCRLQYEQEELKQNDIKYECKWTGELRDLPEHINQHCQLVIVTCSYCNQSFGKYEIKQHDAVCPEKPLPCTLKCRLVDTFDINTDTLYFVHN